MSVLPPTTIPEKHLLERVEDSLLPLINLVFLLLMFFLVAGKLSDEPLPKLPYTTKISSQKKPEANIIITATGLWKVQGVTVNSEQLLASLPSPKKSTTLKIAAAQTLTMSDLEILFQLLEQGGHTDILLLTTPKL